MELTRAYKFRIYPDAKRQEEIDERLILAQQFYNKILEKSIASYRNGKTKASMAQFNKFVREIIQEDKKYLKLYSQTRCEIEFRLLRAYQNFFRRIREGNRRAGFPRFRSRDRYKSITYPQDNGSFSIRKDRLRVSRIGTMRIKLHRKIEGAIKTLSCKAESAGMKVTKVDARNTSRECSNCGNIQDMPLSIRENNCSRCGMRLDRNINASINILHRTTTLGQRGSHAQGESVRPQEKAVLEELRTDKTRPLLDAVIE